MVIYSDEITCETLLPTLMSTSIWVYFTSLDDMIVSIYTNNDSVSWLFLRLLLLQLGKNLQTVNWTLGCVSLVSFVVLINGVASSFFKSGRGLRQGCPLALLLFLIVVEGLGRDLLAAKASGDFHGISFGNDITLTHVLFVDDIVMVSDGSEQSLSTLYDILQTFCKSSGMMINEDKSTLLHSKLDDAELITVQNIFCCTADKIEFGLKYLGFFLKPCRYYNKDWDWLVVKVEKRIKNWSFRWLSKGGKLIFVKSVLEAIPMY